MPIVVLDPGHGGSSKVGGSSPNNAKGPTGLLEKDVTLDVARRTRTKLQGRGIDARLTRAGDRNLGLKERATIAQQLEADAFVSIHFNGFDARVQGTETFSHRDASPASESLAAMVQAAMVKATGLKNRGVKTSGFAVLTPSHHAPATAACLVEISFMDVAAEEIRLRTDGYKDNLAGALASAIEDWLVEDERLAIGTEALAAGVAEPQDGYEAIVAEASSADRPDESGGMPAFVDGGGGSPSGGAPSDSQAIPFFVDPLQEVAAADDVGVTDMDRMLEGWRRERLMAPEDGGEVSPEIIIGRDESLDAVLMEILAQRRRGVGIIRTEGIDYGGQRGSWSGTGLLVAPNILLSNHHVLNSAEVAQAAEVAFDYERSAASLTSGRSSEPISSKRYRLDPDRLFVTSPLRGGLDYTFVWIDEVKPADGAIIRMERAAFVISPEERAFLIHHPRGKPKRVSLDRTDIVNARPQSPIVHYTSDSEPGSSGCPVFDRTGRLVALHHASRRNLDGVSTSDGIRPDYVNEGIKVAAIALDLETRRSRPGEPTAMIDTVLGEIYGSDTLAGFFGAAGRAVQPDQSGVERVVDSYAATDQDVDIGFWNIEWFSNRFEKKVDDVATMIVDLGLDIWALIETSPDATESLVETIEEKFGQRFEFAHSEPDAGISKQSTSVIWNPKTVVGRKDEWPADLEWMLHLTSDMEDEIPERRSGPKRGKLFDRYPGLFHFKARRGNRLDFQLVPLHLKAMAEGYDRRRKASRVLRYMIDTMIDRGTADADWVLGGDYNAELESGDFDALVRGGFVPLSAEDEADGALTYIKSPRSLIDHIFLSPNMSRFYSAQDFFILAKEKSQVDYLKRFSDHRPLMLRLSTAVGLRREAPEAGSDDFIARLRAMRAARPVASTTQKAKRHQRQVA